MKLLKKTKLILLSITFIVVFLFTLFKGDYTNKVIFTGDEWDYQSIGVNNYFGYGFLTTGRILPAETYRIDSLSPAKIKFWENFSGRKAYHRGPFYPLFVCLAYQAVGINPIIIKYFQLFLLVVSGFLLVIIGKLAWGEKGFYIGLLGFLVFVALNHRFSEHLMPENWQFLFLSLITICLFYHYRGSKMHSIVLGIILGISLLNKGTTIFLFPLIILIDLYYILFKNRNHLLNMLLFAAAVVFITGTWSVYATIQRHQFTFINTQSGEVLLEGNNEYCTDGLWHPEWKAQANSFYNTDNRDGQPGIVRVVNFYYSNPQYISNFAAKIKQGFSPIYSFIALISLYSVLISWLVLFKAKFQPNIGSRLPAYTIAILLLGFSCFFGFCSKSIHALQFSYVVAGMFFLSAIFYRRLLKVPVTIPLPFVIVFLNFFVFTLAFYVCNETYLSRYVKTMDGIFILTDLYLLFVIFKIPFFKKTV